MRAPIDLALGAWFVGDVDVSFERVLLTDLPKRSRLRSFDLGAEGLRFEFSRPDHKENKAWI